MFQFQAQVVDFADDFEDPILFADQWFQVAQPHGDDSVFNLISDHPVVPSAYGFVQGDRLIRTWNKGVTTPPTEAPIIGDGPTGVAESATFTLGNLAEVSFRIGGGNHAWSGGTDPSVVPAGVATFNLEVMNNGSWEVVRTATGTNVNDVNFTKLWNVDAYAGQEARLRIYDTATGGWGHIDVDDIMVTSQPDRVGIQVHTFEDPAEFASNWTKVAQPHGDDSLFTTMTDGPVVPSAYDLTSIEGDRIIRTWNQGETTPPSAAPIVGDGPTGCD